MNMDMKWNLMLSREEAERFISKTNWEANVLSLLLKEVKFTIEKQHIKYE